MATCGSRCWARFDSDRREIGADGDIAQGLRPQLFDDFNSAGKKRVLRACKGDGLGPDADVGDAYDLSWKLAATLQGWGGETLLDSYDTERRPVAHTNVAASTNYFRRLRSVFPTGLALDEDTMRGEEAREAFTEAFAEVRKRNIFHISEQVRLGYCYEPSPIVVADGTAAPEISSMNYIPNARPGTRAPHLYLDDGRSLLDVFGDGFVLLRIGSEPPSCDGLTAVVRR